MPRIKLKKDNLNEQNANFEHNRLKQPLFLNSVPKSGSHLMRNIMRMFVPLNQHYKSGFIQIPSMKVDKVAWNKDKPTLSWGHLLFSDESALFLRDTRQILLARDPYDWVLARARFFMSDEFQGSLNHIKNNRITVEELLNMMIFGIHRKVPMLQEIYLHNCVSWLGAKAVLVKFENLVENVTNLDSDEAEEFFLQLFDDCGIDPVPDDWRERVRVGSDREQSGTARENLTGVVVEVPDELPDIQKKMVDMTVPGLRNLLGYE
ncbi:MAG: hypothetical protein IID51_00765 [Proteobacteria bacterium]|nr:hypothetical protein [Pseudomonadota bacterium]